MLYAVLKAATTASTSYSSEVILMRDGTTVFIQFYCPTGVNVAGTVALEAQASDAAPWVEIAGTSQAVTASGSVVYDGVPTAAPRVRLTWTYTSGTGTTTTVMNIKDLEFSSRSKEGQVEVP